MFNPSPPLLCLKRSNSIIKSKEICVQVDESKTREEEEQIENQLMPSLKTEFTKPKISESPFYKKGV
jgi:hypothetical protein